MFMQPALAAHPSFTSIGEEAADIFSGFSGSSSSAAHVPVQCQGHPGFSDVNLCAAPPGFLNSYGFGMQMGMPGKMVGAWSPLPDPPPVPEPPPAPANVRRPLFRNIGSGGHPELCANTCMDFQIGSCLQGADCFLCHCQHPDKHVKLDKKQREALKSLTQRETLEILARRVWDRAQVRDMTTEMFPLLQLILQQLYVLPESEPTLSPSGLRNLEKTMGKMTSKRMIIHASTNPNMDPAFAKSMEEEVLALRRHLALGSGSSSKLLSSVWL